MRALFWLSAIFTIVGLDLRDLIDHWASYPIWVKLLLILSVLSALTFLVYDIWCLWRNQPKKYGCEKDVNRYMYNLIRRGGSAWIFANNLSWVKNAPEVRNLLKNRAKACKDIRIFVPRQNDITRDLARPGVRITTYESLAYEPEARFTLLNPKEPGFLLAIGKGAFPNFYIEEFPDATHSRAISVARDLFQIIEKVYCRDHAEGIVTNGTATLS